MQRRFRGLQVSSLIEMATSSLIWSVGEISGCNT